MTLGKRDIDEIADFGRDSRFAHRRDPKVAVSMVICPDRL
ncbi:hypothetical protein D779_3089 [Imhoffiella purpurea]|uniref:Uncharacterized protein n=1 Tax=Imhoffiella purpurea TaxID=1249627 RepID=W9V3X1_9GAMM|nr:hypothetical protein D779_3089 [Imhoffiella purpurea]